MSVLSFPRLYFRGVMSWDPIVSNNDPTNYDGIAARARLAPGETVGCFRQRMIASTVERGDWNYFGTHVCTLEEAQITGGTLNPGDGDTLDDALIGAPVGLTGKLVDIDPAGVPSQLFFDEFTLGLPGNPHLRALPARRMTSRWFNFSRNLAPLPIGGSAAAAWQAVFPAATLEFTRAAESPLLARLEKALGGSAVRGLMLRLSTYRTQYFQNGKRNPLEPVASLEDLQRLHEQGKPVSNPAYSLVVGAVGLWVDDDSEGVLGGRLLFSQASAPVHNMMSRTATTGHATAEFDPGTKLLSFDLSNTIPELDENLEKADFGPIAVVVTKDGSSTQIAHIDYAAYDRAAYEARAGIIDLTVSAHLDAASLLPEGTLSLRVDTPSGSAVLLAEQELTAFCNDGNIYLDEGESRTVVVHARQRGQVPVGGLSVLVAWYAQSGQFSGELTVLPVAADGTAELHVTAEETGYRYLRFSAFAGAAAPVPPAQFSIITDQFTCVRTLPFDDEFAATIPDEALTWEFIYSTILRNYDAIAPRMNNIIDLRDAAAVLTFARRVKEVTSPELFESPRYMPVSRDLSRGKRALLHRFCDLALVPSPAEAPPETTVAGAPGDRPVQATERLPGVPANLPFDKRARW